MLQYCYHLTQLCGLTQSHRSDDDDDDEDEDDELKHLVELDESLVNTLAPSAPPSGRTRPRRLGITSSR